MRLTNFNELQTAITQITGGKPMQNVTMKDIPKILANPAIHNFTKHIFEKGSQLDCLDAYYDAVLAVKMLKAKLDYSLGN